MLNLIYPRSPGSFTSPSGSVCKLQGTKWFVKSLFMFMEVELLKSGFIEMGTRGRAFLAGEQQVQRPWGEYTFGRFKEQ